MEILNFLGASVIMIGAFWFCYMSFHVVEEQKQQKHIPLPWEEGGFLRKLFTKFK